MTQVQEETKQKKCSDCKGYGMIRKQDNTETSFMSMSVGCNTCKGTGYVSQD